MNLLQQKQENKQIMRNDSEGSEDEGFYKPVMQISKPVPPAQTQYTTIEQEFDNPIQIITEDRPVDFQPRFLNSQLTFYTNCHILDKSSNSEPGELMQSIAYNKTNSKDSKETKQKRFCSLQAKYKNNIEYSLVYSKIPQNTEFSSYIFSLENTPDYNPSDYSLVSSQGLPESSVFDSRFESGNLLYAFKKMKNSQIPEYDLILQNDTNTKGYSQWFYFSIRNKDINSKRIRINIINFIKKNLMFLDGARPVAFSTKSYDKKGQQWYFAGQNISFGKSYITRQIQVNPPQFKNYYTFSFDLVFPQSDDLVYVALNFPYTYSRMIKHIDSLKANCTQRLKIERKILCHSISNNPIPYLIIQNSIKSVDKTILCLCRQHPGETVGSFVLEAFLDQIVKKEKIFQQFKLVVVPMINPDGVIYGNFRTNLAGFDLNRQWKEPNRWLHPEIFFLSKLISSLQNLQFCLDFHGHSKKMNSFIYACVDEKINQFRLYPYIFGQKCDLFSIKDCTYNITVDKLKTARVNVYNSVKKPNIFTLETSLFGHTKYNKYQRFALTDFSTIAKGAVESLQILMTDKKAVLKYEKEVQDKNYLFQQWAFQNKQDYGSESNPSEDQLNPIERKTKVMSDLKMKRPAKKNLRRVLKRKKQRSPKKKKQIYHFTLKQKADSASLLDNKRTQKVVPASLKANGDNSVIIVEDSSKKLKSEARRQISNAYLEPKLKPPPAAIPRVQQIKTMGPNAIRIDQQQREAEKQKLINTINSNLFDTKNYLKMREQICFQLKKTQLTNEKDGKSFKVTQKSSSRFDKLRAQKLKRQFEQLIPVYSQPKKKNREKVYVIKQNKVVSSITRIHEQQIKYKIQKQISNRTMVLKNCQKVMNGFPLERQKPSLSMDRSSFLYQQELYKAKKLLKPLQIKGNQSFNDIRNEEKGGVFFSFLEQ